jgi:hypothetical protein
VIALSITAAVWLAALLFRRTGRVSRLDRLEMVRHRRESEKERQEWIYPFDL